jgi:hypothetical protein
MKYGLYRMICALALTRFPNWARMYGSQELANSSRRINGILTERLLFIRLSCRISKNVEGGTRRDAIFSESISIGAIISYHLKWPYHLQWLSVHWVRRDGQRASATAESTGSASPIPAIDLQSPQLRRGLKHVEGISTTRIWRDIRVPWSFWLQFIGSFLRKPGTRIRSRPQQHESARSFSREYDNHPRNYAGWRWVGHPEEEIVVKSEWSIRVMIPWHSTGSSCGEIQIGAWLQGNENFLRDPVLQTQWKASFALWGWLQQREDIWLSVIFLKIIRGGQEFLRLAYTLKDL